MAMQHIEDELRRTGDPRDLEDANTVAYMLKARGKDIPLPSATTTPVEAKPLSQEFRPFIKQEREALIKDDAVILNLHGDTIEQERKEGRLFWVITNGGDRLLRLSSINTQVAIYPDPRKFFIPNSGNKDLPSQEKLAEKDGRELRERLGIKDDGLEVIIPDQASTLTEVIFRYLDETAKTGKGVWLFGPEYSYFYGRTKNPVNESGSHVARVGDAGSATGVTVLGWDRDFGHGSVHVVRLVVAKKK